LRLQSLFSFSFGYTFPSLNFYDLYFMFVSGAVFWKASVVVFTMVAHEITPSTGVQAVSTNVALGTDQGRFSAAFFCVTVL